jgi:DNA-binding NtrC family response regulator
MAEQHRVLVVDDDVEVTRFLADMLRAHGYRANAVNSGAAATQAIERDPVDVVITDLRMGDVSGLDLIAWIKRFDPRIAVVAITAFGSIDTAIRAIKLGAFDYVTKPFSPDALLIAVEKATREREMRIELVRLREAVDRSHGLDGIVGKSHALEDAVALVRRVAPTPTTVLITGAMGTGKETFARAIHALSPRRQRPVVTINCGAVPDAVLEGELFGHDGGDAGGRAGVFREAQGGTLVLNEIGALPLALQARLLRVLEDHVVRPVGTTVPVPADVRVVATTDRDLSADVAARAFREDLFYRLRVVEIVLPPLRDRVEDIPVLAQHFLGLYAERLGKKIVGFNEAALKQLAAYVWPGNVRELENAVERAVTLCEHNVVRPEDLPDLIRTRPDTDFLAMAAAREMTLAELERAYMLRVLERTGGNKLRAAQILGIDRKTIYRWLGGHGSIESAAVAAAEKGEA